VPVKPYHNSLTICGDLINGVELNFDLNTSQDFTTGQEENKTDLWVSKDYLMTD
jgi:hypothetical protein